MSHDERLMILQMVADKKISASEAAELLKALDSKGDAPRPAQPGPQGGPRSFVPPAPPRAPAAPPPPSGSAGGFGAGLSSFIEDMIERVTGAFSDSIEPKYEFPSEMRGVFTADLIPLRINTRNGHIEVKGWDEPGYKANILVKARGDNEEQARVRAADAYVLRADEDGFDLESTRRFEWSDQAVHVTLWVPNQKRYRIDLRSGNGHIEVEGITVEDGNGSSGNGRINFERGAADQLYLRSGNGSITVEGDVADLDAGTGNGSVKVVPMGRRSEKHVIKTGNGSVRVDTGRISREAGLQVDASTGMGGVTVTRGDLVYEKDERAMGHKHLIATTTNWGQVAVKVAVRARTGLGSVTIE